MILCQFFDQSLQDQSVLSNASNVHDLAGEVGADCLSVVSGISHIL